MDRLRRTRIAQLFEDLREELVAGGVLRPKADEDEEVRDEWARAEAERLVEWSRSRSKPNASDTRRARHRRGRAARLFRELQETLVAVGALDAEASEDERVVNERAQAIAERLLAHARRNRE